MMICQLHIDTGVLDVGRTYIPIEDTAVFLFGFSSQVPLFNMGVEVMGPAYNFEP